MAAVKAGDVDRILRALPSEAAVLLIYGPDLGRVAERARAVATGPVAGDTPDVVRLDGNDVADEPGRLLDEAMSYGLFGSRRVIWVKAGSRNLAAAVETCLDAPLGDTRIVIEAGDLAKSSPLRAAAERSKRALALPCYPDEERDLGAVISEELRREGMEIDGEARELLVEHLGGDRLATRSELAKLILYARGRPRISADDVRAVVSDVSSVSLDAAIDAAFSGHAASLDETLLGLFQNNTAPAAILSAALRHALALVGARSELERNRGIEDVLATWRGLHFRRRSAVQAQLRRWPTRSLLRAVRHLEAATLETRRSPGIAQAVTSRALFGLAQRSLAPQAAGAT